MLEKIRIKYFQYLAISCPFETKYKGKMLPTRMVEGGAIMEDR
jgi:hypothetical protein